MNRSCTPGSLKSRNVITIKTDRRKRNTKECIMTLGSFAFRPLYSVPILCLISGLARFFLFTIRMLMKMKGRRLRTTRMPLASPIYVCYVGSTTCLVVKRSYTITVQAAIWNLRVL